MNKTLSLLCVSFVTLLLIATTFAFAATSAPATTPVEPVTGETIEVGEAVPVEEIPVSIDETEIQKEIDSNIKLPVVKIASIWAGFVVSEDDTKAEHLRAVITRERFSKVLSALDETTIQEIKNIKSAESVEAAKEKIKTLLQERVNALPEDKTGVIGGLLFIGKGKTHETYRLVAKEITEESAIFDVYKLGALKISAKTKAGFFIGLRKALGLAKEEETTEVTQEVNSDLLAPIGTLTVTRLKYDNIEIDTGTLVLQDSQYSGNWDVTAYSAHKLPVYKKVSSEAGSQTQTGQAVKEWITQNQQQ